MNCSVNVFGIKQLSTDKVDKPIKNYKTMDNVTMNLIKAKIKLIRKELDWIEEHLSSIPSETGMSNMNETKLEVTIKPPAQATLKLKGAMNKY